jgi:hypothetical protein
MYFFGIDVAKKQHEACVIDDQGTTVLAMPVPNTQPGAARFLAAVRKRVANDPHAVASASKLQDTTSCRFTAS